MTFTAQQAEFWGDLQVDLYTANSAIYLANQSLEKILSTDGRKAHRPILSNPQTGTYTPHVDIEFEEKTSIKQTLEVDTFKYSAEDIDHTEKSQTPYDLVQHSLKSIRKGLMNIVEQQYLSEITNAGQSIATSPVEILSSNILDIMEEAEGKLGAYDAPYETALRAMVMGPRTVAKLRRTKSDRESKLGDSVLSNGVIGPWQGWTVVQNNNLPWTGTLTIATKPTDGDTVVIQGVTFTFKDTIASAGHVYIGANVAASRANLKLAVENGAVGTAYVQLSIKDRFMISRKRGITLDGSAEAMVFSGFGDISVSETFTDATDGWSLLQQSSVFMIRGSIDLVLQLMELEVGSKEAGFADLPKGLIGVGAKTFSDGADLMVKVTQDASNF